MTRLSWALHRLPVSLLVAGVGRSQALPAAAGDRRARGVAARLGSLGLRALEGSARAGVRRLEDPEGRWRELVNKVRAFVEFRSAGDPGPLEAGDPAAGADTGDAAAAGADSGDAEEFAELWRREGRGYLWGRQAAAGAEAAVGDLPPRELLPHHTGLGLGLAAHQFEKQSGRAPAAAVDLAVERFLADSRRLSRPGYESAVVEALGLAVRLLQPRLVRRVDEALDRRSPTARRLFWHGLGRGIYFDPGEMPPRPGRCWRAAERALEMPPDEEMKRNAVAGLAWAATLVNFRHPEIVASRLRSAALQEAGDAAANGIASVALLWLDAVGDGPSLRRFRDHRAAPGAAGEELWRRHVAAPLGVAIDRVYPLLVRQERIDELFRYRPVDGWASSLAEDRVSGAARRMEAPIHG